MSCTKLKFSENTIWATLILDCNVKIFFPIPVLKLSQSLLRWFHCNCFKSHEECIGSAKEKKLTHFSEPHYV